MDFTSRPILAGAGGLILGLLIGLMIGNSGKSALEAEIESQRAALANVGTLSGTVDAVGARMSALEERLGSVEGSVTSLAETQTGRIEALAQRLDGVGSELGGAVSGVGSSVAASLSDRFDAIRSELAAMGERMRAPASAGGAAPAAGGEPPAGEFVRIGNTIALGEGLRVFLSGIDEADGTARVAINGPTTRTLSVGETAEVGACTVTLNGFSEGGAVFEGGCGDDEQSGADAPTTGTDTATATPPTGETIGVGGIGSFADGKVRLFLSGVDPEAKAARVALNGVTTTRLRLAEPAEAAGCRVTLTGIDASRASFDVSC
jgi:hypothetical protein